MREDRNGFFLKCRVSASPFCWPPAAPAPRRPSPGPRARATGSLSVRHRAAWGRCQGAGGRQCGAAFAVQPQGFGAEGRIIARPFCRRSFCHEMGKLVLKFSPVLPNHLKQPLLMWQRIPVTATRPRGRALAESPRLYPVGRMLR